MSATVLTTTVIGIDLAKASTGIAIRSKGAESTFVISQPKESPHQYHAYSVIAAEITKTIKPNALVLIEGYALGAIKGAIPLVELGGIVRLLITKITGNPPVIVPAPTLKKFLMANANTAKKDQMRVECYKRYGREFTSHDEMDAWILSEMGCSLLGYPEKPLTVRQREALKKVEKSNPHALAPFTVVF